MIRNTMIDSIKTPATTDTIMAQRGKTAGVSLLPVPLLFPVGLSTGGINGSVGYWVGF